MHTRKYGIRKHRDKTTIIVALRQDYSGFNIEPKETAGEDN
jgi:hypothetical protein